MNKRVMYTCLCLCLKYVKQEKFSYSDYLIFDERDESYLISFFISNRVDRHGMKRMRMKRRFPSDDFLCRRHNPSLDTSVVMRKMTKMSLMLALSRK